MQTLRKHNLSHSVFLRWKNQFNQGGVKLLEPQYHKIDPEFRALQEENVRLKRSSATRHWNWSSKPNFQKSEAYERRLRGHKIVPPKRVATRRLLQWSSMQSSSYHYKASGLLRGIRPSIRASMQMENSLTIQCNTGY